jgi:primosomal protein N'
MKKCLVFLLILLLTATLAAAMDSTTIKSKQGDVTFNHKIHSASIKCTVCHSKKAPGKMTLGRDAAHKLCKGCHEKDKKGPVKCFDCHKKRK